MDGGLTAQLTPEVTALIVRARLAGVVLEPLQIAASLAQGLYTIDTLELAVGFWERSSPLRNKAWNS